MFTDEEVEQLPRRDPHEVVDDEVPQSQRDSWASTNCSRSDRTQLTSSSSGRCSTKLGPRVKRLLGVVDCESDRDAQAELTVSHAAGCEPRPSQNTPALWNSKINLTKSTPSTTSPKSSHSGSLGRVEKLDQQAERPLRRTTTTKAKADQGPPTTNPHSRGNVPKGAQ